MRVRFYVMRPIWTLGDGCVYLPLCNPLTYFESSLGSDLVQKESAKPTQHEKCPNQKHMKDDR